MGKARMSTKQVKCAAAEARARDDRETGFCPSGTNQEGLGGRMRGELSHLSGQRDARRRAGRAGEPGVEVGTAGGQHGAVRAEGPALHQHRHVAQLVLPPLLVQAAQHVGAVHRRLVGEHRVLTQPHSASGAASGGSERACF